MKNSVRMLSALEDNTLRDLHNSSYPTKAELNNDICFIIYSKYFPIFKGVSPFHSLSAHLKLHNPVPRFFLYVF